MWSREAGEMEATCMRTTQQSPFTRAPPGWSLKDTLVLIKAIADVESDCSEEVSSYQKWKSIADRCCSSDVIKTSIQCHKKWTALFGEYKNIKFWETGNGIGSYWSLSLQTRKELTLPVDFGEQLFTAIQNLLFSTGELSNSEFEDYSDREVDITTSGPRKVGSGCSEKGINKLEVALKVCKKAEQVIALAEESSESDIPAGIIRTRGDDLISCFREVEDDLRRLIHHINK